MARIKPLAAARGPSATALMDWAQTAYPQYFPGRRGNLAYGDYLFRYYPETGYYLGVSGDVVYVKGAVTGGGISPVGSLSSFACNVYPASCDPQGGDARNGIYTAYATTGERFTLTLDFDARQFTVGGPQASIVALSDSGAITDDVVPGTYWLQGAATSANSKFRYVDDLIVGAFPVHGGTKPFVASRNFALSVAEIAGTYSNLGINGTGTSEDSRIYTTRIRDDATMQLCTNSTIYAIDNCPAATVLNYNLTLSGNQFTATATPAGAAGTFSFRVAKAGNENVFLMGGLDFAAGTRFFRIGLAESGAFAAGSARGATSWGEWGAATFTASSYSSTGVAADGHAISLSGSLGSMGAVGPSGMRHFQASYGGFAIQNTQLAVLLGARGTSAAGYMQIGSK